MTMQNRQKWNAKKNIKKDMLFPNLKLKIYRNLKKTQCKDLQLHGA